VHFVLRNSSDREQIKGAPVLLSQLSGVPLPTPERAIQKTVRTAPKPYTVETFMGPTVKTENFQ
jgi:hypothetical protein